ncbi:MAG: glycosyltransferase family 39 protein [Planctomycetota bacterium]|nr:glycosyltransferase family 39 protein [Planctomycetota bacterium]
MFAVGAVLAVHLVFIALNRRTFSYDDAWYADTAIRFLDAWSAEGLPGAYEFFVNKTFMGNKAPLIILPPQPFLLIFGRHDFVFPLSNLMCLIGVAAYLAALTRSLGGRAMGTLAALVFCMMPLTMYVTRIFFVELLVTLLVLMFIFHGLESRHFTHRGHALLAGLALGLGLLAKVLFPLYVGGVVILLLWGASRRHGSVLSVLLTMALACVGPALACGGPALLAVGELLISLGAPRQGSAVSGMGELLAFTGSVYVGLALSGIALVVLWWWRRPAWRFNLAAAASVGLWVSLIWYLPNFKTIAEFTYSNSIGQVSKDYGSANILDLDAIGRYWLGNVNTGFGVVFGLALTVLLLVLALVLLVTLRRRSRIATRVWRGLLVIVAWLIPALIVFTLGRNRTTRFLLPLFPALVIFYAVLIQVLAERARLLSVTLGVTHVAAAAGAFMILTFGGPTVEFGSGNRFVVCGPRLSGRGNITRVSYPLDQVVAAARRVAPLYAQRPALAMFLTDTVHVNQNTLLYAAAKARAPLIFGLVPYGVSHDVAIKALDRADLLIFQEGGTDFPDFTNSNAARVLRDLREGDIPGWQFDPDPAVQLPDGGVVRFAKRATRPSETEIVSCSVLYLDDAFELTGVGLFRRAGMLHVTTRWRKQRLDEGRYAIAAHLISLDRSFQHNIDHGPIEGPTHFADMKIGDSVTVLKTEIVSEWAERAEYLAIALYDLTEKRNVDCRVVECDGFLKDDWLLLPLPAAETR